LTNPFDLASARSRCLGTPVNRTASHFAFSPKAIALALFMPIDRLVAQPTENSHADHVAEEGDEIIVQATRSGRRVQG
jgi:hypothetical protein